MKPSNASAVIARMLNISKLYYHIQKIFSSNRSTGPIRSSSRDVRPSVCLLMSPFHVLDYEAYLPPLPEVRCPNFLEIWNPWETVLERSVLRTEQFCWEVV